MGRLDEGLYVGGNLSAATMTIPAGTVTNAAVSASAGIVATKTVPQHVITYGQANTAAADETRVIHAAYGAGTVIAVHAGSIGIAVGDATCTVDVKKDGTTILSAVITLDTGNTVYTPKAGTVSVSSYAATDVFTVVIDGTIGTGTLPTGVYVRLIVREAAE